MIFFYFMIGVITTVNMIALKEFYWNSIRQYVSQIQDVHDAVKSWKLTAVLYFSLACLRFKQWFHSTTQPLPDGKYILSHYINGQSVKIIIKPASKLPQFVVDEEYNECFIDEALPFLRYEYVPFSNESINVEKAVIIGYE